MAAIDFPNSPTLNQQFTAAGKTWFWNGSSWNLTIQLSATEPVLFDSATNTISLGPIDGGTA